jgi:hypothetical protein
MHHYDIIAPLGQEEGGLSKLTHRFSRENTRTICDESSNREPLPLRKWSYAKFAYAVASGERGWGEIRLGQQNSANEGVRSSLTSRTPAEMRHFELQCSADIGCKSISWTLDAGYLRRKAGGT